MNTQHGLIHCQEMFKGTIDGAAVYPREIVRANLSFNLSAVIFTHNHPSGICEPSVSNRQITEKLKQFLELNDIRVLDHMIVGEVRNIFFREET